MLTLKAKDSESSENEPIIETDIFNQMQTHLIRRIHRNILI